MKSQIIVAIGREHGSGGHYIGKMVSEQLGIRFYDREIVQGITEKSGYSPDLVEKLDEAPVNFLLSRRIGAYSNSLEENVAEKTFEFLRGLAAGGESFVTVGRCADYILRDNPSLFRVFVCGGQEEKVKRVMSSDGVTETKAKDIIRVTDRKRKAYHDYYCDGRWGDSRGYDITVNSSKLGLKMTATVLTECVRAFMEI